MKGPDIPLLSGTKSPTITPCVLKGSDIPLVKDKNERSKHLIKF